MKIGAKVIIGAIGRKSLVNTFPLHLLIRKLFVFLFFLFFVFFFVFFFI